MSEYAALDRRMVAVTGAVILGAVMTVLDATAVNVAVDRLVSDLRTSLASAQWVLTGYLLMLALVVPLCAWATDRFGATRLWLASLALFLAGSALSGAAWSIGSLIAFRLVQGLGGGMIAPLAQTILARAAGPARMGRVMSMLGVVTVLGPVIGPVVGGVLVQDVGWRWIFFINLPIGALALAAAVRVLPRLSGRRSMRLDSAGLALASLGLAGITYGLGRVSHAELGDPGVITPVAAGIALMVWFVLHCRRRGHTALIDIRLFADRGFAAAATALLFVGMVVFGALLLLPLYFQSVRGQGPLGAGLLLAPQGVGVAAMLPVAGRLTDRWGAKSVVVPGVVLMLAGTVVYTQVSAHTPHTFLMVALVIRGIGMGLVMTPITAAAFVRLPTTALANASSTTTAIRQVGGSLGTAVLSVLLARGLGATDPAHAYDVAFWAACGLTAVVLVPAFLLARRA